MKLLFLGTGAGRPTLVRNVTSIALLPSGPRGAFWLFDAGEGTQHRLLQAKLKLNRLERIFITHLHGDHLYGLPGILGSRTFYEGSGKLRLYGPPGLRAYVDAVLEHSGLHLNYELEVAEAADGRLFDEAGEFAVETGELRHRIRSFGYRIACRPRPGSLDAEALARLGLPPGPLYGKLKRGEDVTLPDGRTIRSADVVGSPIPGKVVTVLGDTSPCEAAVRLAKDADLLVHEATFGAGMEEKAVRYGHSTVIQAAEEAALAGARRLVVTHFSARYDDEAIEQLVRDGQAVFPRLEAARDLMEVDVS